MYVLIDHSQIYFQYIAQYSSLVPCGELIP